MTAVVEDEAVVSAEVALTIGTKFRGEAEDANSRHERRIAGHTYRARRHHAEAAQIGRLRILSRSS
jgi:hypothetical protein